MKAINEKNIEFLIRDYPIYGARCCSDSLGIPIGTIYLYAYLHKIKRYKNNQNTKTCSKCKIEKPRAEFHINRAAKSGLCSKCKICHNQDTRASYDLNPIIVENREKKRKKSSETEKICSTCRTLKSLFDFYLNKNKKFTASCKTCYQTKTKNNKLKDPERHKKLDRTRSQIRKQNDLQYKILCNLRSFIVGAIKKNRKSKKTVELLGCSVDFFIKYIESKFQNGMTWKNYGRYDSKRKTWQYDHIIPCDSFDLSDPEQQQKCFNYLNVQPLWAEDNIKKGNKLNWGGSN